MPKTKATKEAVEPDTKSKNAPIEWVQVGLAYMGRSLQPLARERRKNMADCENLHASSQYVRNWIRKQSEVKEESLTDWLLFDVSQKISKITYKAFSRHEEARKTGADWEWWFLFPSFAFKMRIQAKKLSSSEDNYPAIAYTNTYGLQIEKLLKDAAREDFMPLYAFYTSEQADVMCQMQRNDEGVFMAGGQRIHDAVIAVPRQPVTARDLLKHTIALSCFLCCPLASGKNRGRAPSGNDDEDGWVEFIKHYYKSELKPTKSEVDTQGEHIPGMHEQIPSYIQSFITAGEKGVPDGWEREYHHSLENVNALLVYDARQKPTNY
ncbi:MAG: hypothetical protein NTX50_29600 [Candidatus Sumerlaeota bacterium]|nr:hypothetical protein [Candidatus Sumerlaeota bacterium]